MSEPTQRKARRKRARARRRAETQTEAAPSEDEGTEEAVPEPATDTIALRDHLERKTIEALPHQRRLALGGSLTIVGLGLVGSGQSDIGALVVLAGLLFLMYAIHRFGRLGAEG